MKLFVSPHNDDAVLFGAFTLQREDPAVLTVFDSYVQPAAGHAECSVRARRKEDLKAINEILRCSTFYGAVRDDEKPHMIRSAVHHALAQWTPTEVWLPAVEMDGHEQHNLVGEVGLEVFAQATIHRYLTYTRSGGKSTAGTKVECNGPMVLKKLQALACYRTQIEIDAVGCWPHFLRDQNEYVMSEAQV